MNSPESFVPKFDDVNNDIENIPDEEVSKVLHRLEEIKEKSPEELARDDMKAILGPNAQKIENEIEKTEENLGSFGEKVLDLDVEINNHTSRNFSRELVSFYISKAVEQLSGEGFAKLFAQLDINGLEDVSEVNIFPVNNKEKWARFEIGIKTKKGRLESIFSSMFNIGNKKFIFFLTDEEKIVV